jgi:hypothetical protein
MGGQSCAGLIHIKIAARRSSAELRSALFVRRTSMMDAVMLALAFVFFALSIGYVYGCDRL